MKRSTKITFAVATPTAVFVVLLVVIASVWWQTIGSTTRKSVSLDDLALVGDHSPAAIDKGLEFEGDFGQALYSEHRAISMRWRSGASVTEFDQNVIYFGKSTRAAIHYRTDDPADRYRHLYKRRIQRVAVDERFVSADSWAITCGLYDGPDSNNPSECVVWIFWARCGQYLVYLRLVTQGTDVNAFLPYVRLADKHFQDVIPRR